VIHAPLTAQKSWLGTMTVACVSGCLLNGSDRRGAEDAATSSSTTGTIDSSSTTTGLGATDTSGPTESSESPGSGSGTLMESSSGDGPSCEFDDHFRCEEVPWECTYDEGSAFHCGAPTSWLDENGCLRQECGVDSTCPAGFECFAPHDACEVCVGPRPICDETETAEGVGCVCGQDGGCQGYVCVPSELLIGDPCPP